MKSYNKSLIFLLLFSCFCLDKNLIAMDAGSGQATDQTNTQMVTDPVVQPEIQPEEVKVPEKLENESVSVFNSIKDTLKNSAEKIKEAINNLNVDSAVIEIKINLPGDRGSIEAIIPIEPGIQIVDKGFNPAPILFKSPTIGQLKIPKMDTFTNAVKQITFGAVDFNEARLFNMLLNVDLTENEKIILGIKAIGNFFEQTRKLFNPVFAPFEKMLYIENGIGYLKPIHVACIKLALLLKTYIPNEKAKLTQTIPFFFTKFLNTADWDKSKILEENFYTDETGQKLLKPWITWTKFVTYSDPEVLNEIIPSFIKDIINKLPLSVSLDEYYNIQDGVSDYLVKLSDTWRRGTIDSKTYYFIQNVVPEFKNIKTATDVLKTYVTILQLTQKFDEAKNKQVVRKQLDSIINDFIEILSKISIPGELGNWKKQIIDQFKKLKNSVNFKILDNQSDIIGMKDNSGLFDKKLNLIKYLGYFKKKINKFLNYKHLGEQGYIFDLSELTNKQAIEILLGLLYRFYKDIKVATAKVSAPGSDTTVTIDNKQVNLGPKAFADKVGVAGLYDRSINKFTKEGSGLVWAEQKAQVAFMTADKKAENYITLRNDYLKAKDATTKAKGAYLFDVSRGINLDIAGKQKSPYDAMLSDLNILLRRIKNVKPVIDALASMYASIGIPFPSVTVEEDLKDSSSPVEISFFVEEQGAGMSVSDFDMNRDFGSLDF